jgi:hypothetical protein
MNKICLHNGLSIAFILLFISCDIFQPRTPEEPGEARGNFIPPTTPDIVIENFLNAINERNTQHYVQCLIDVSFTEKKFSFLPTQRAQIQFGALFEEWSAQEERMYFENLISSIPGTSTLRLVLQDGLFESQSANDAVYIASYRLVAQHTNEGYPHYVFEGTLRFEMFSDQSNNWAIYRWADFPGGDNQSWSELKGTFKL